MSPSFSFLKQDLRCGMKLTRCHGAMPCRRLDLCQRSRTCSCACLDTRVRRARLSAGTDSPFIRSSCNADASLKFVVCFVGDARSSIAMLDGGTGRCSVYRVRRAKTVHKLLAMDLGFSSEYSPLRSCIRPLCRGP